MKKARWFGKTPWGGLKVGRSELALLVVLSLVYAASEGVSVGMIFPVLEFIEKGRFNPDSVPIFGDAIVWMTATFRLPLTLPVLLICASVPVLLRQILYFYRYSYVAAVQERIIARLREEALGAVMHADLSVFTGVGQGRLVSGLTTEATRAAEAVYFTINLVTVVGLLLMYALLLLALSPMLSGVAVLFIGLSGLLMVTKVRMSRRYGEQLSQANNELHASIAERISGIRLIRLQAREDPEIGAAAAIVRRARDLMIRLTRILYGMESVTESFVMIGGFFVLYVAATWLQLSLAIIGLFSFILLRIAPFAKELNTTIQKISSRMGSYENVQRLLKTARDSWHIVGGARRFDRLRHAIEFDHVSFSYDADEEGAGVLHDISFTIARGEVTAIVGRSGAGKSTIVDLIPRLRDVTAGEIRFDGVPIREFDLTSLRRAIGFVSQDVFLFHDTVLNNIRYGTPDATLEQVVAAATQAHAHQFISGMAQGYDTIIGDRGLRLSGGERQRLSIARMFLQDPDILVLDEPTSALDSESEQYVQTVLAAFRGSKTIVVIGHRLSTIRQADQIIVIERGRIVERGRHGTLVEESGLYRRLFDLQLQA